MIDFILEMATVNEQVITVEELYKAEDETAAKPAKKAAKKAAKKHGQKGSGKEGREKGCCQEGRKK